MDKCLLGLDADLVENQEKIPEPIESSTDAPLLEVTGAGHGSAVVAHGA